VLEEERGRENLNEHKSSNFKPDYTIWLTIPNNILMGYLKDVKIILMAEKERRL
jgi:hypothetical protein